MMNLFYISLFPSMFEGPLKESILDRARKAGVFSFKVINPRDYSQNIHNKVDDYSYGGGPGMVLEPDSFYRAHRHIEEKYSPQSHTVLLAPTGKVFEQADAERWSQKEQIVFICGHYEGFDERISELADEVISLGDFVLTGGELPAMVMTDAVIRLLPGVLGNDEGAEQESFSDSLLEHPQYTRPPVFDGKEVPSVLLSGHHQEINRWRRKKSLERTLAKRPDLIAGAKLTDQDLKLLEINPGKWEDAE